MQSGSHHFCAASVFPWFLRKGDINWILAAWASLTSRMTLSSLVSALSPGEGSLSLPTCVPAPALSHSVRTFCSFCLDSRPQPIHPSGLLLKCHSFLTARYLIGSSTFPLVACLTFELTCFVRLSVRPQSLLWFGHLQEDQSSSYARLVPCCTPSIVLQIMT